MQPLCQYMTDSISGHCAGCTCKLSVRRRQEVAEKKGAEKDAALGEDEEQFSLREEVQECLRRMARLVARGSRFHRRETL